MNTTLTVGLIGFAITLALDLFGVSYSTSATPGYSQVPSGRPGSLVHRVGRIDGRRFRRIPVEIISYDPNES